MAETAPEGRFVEEDQISILQFSSIILRRRWTIVRATASISLLALILVLLTEKKYTASTSFIPQGAEEGSMSSLAGLAGQFGFQLPFQTSSESPEFYAELVNSREILGVLATERFQFEGHEGDGDTVSGILPDLMEIETGEENQAIRRNEAIKWLREQSISVSTGRETGIVAVAVTTPWAGLSKVMADRMLELLNEFNLQTRQSQAAAERRFVEDRLAEVEDSLRAAEDQLAAFLQTNRSWENSPELTFQQGRLQRQVTMRQQVFTTLAEAHEQARIAEVRNTPVITVVERPELPVKADRRRRVIKLAFGIALAGMLGVFLAIGKESLERVRKEEEEEFQEFSILLAQSWKDLKTFGGVFGKGKS